MDKRDIAIEHLRVAIRAYLDDEDYFAAAVLAHTAGDILDSILKGHGAETALDELVAGTKAVQRQVFGDEPKDSAIRRLDRESRNSAKHMDVTGPGDWSDRIYPHNAKQAAFDAIDTALENLYRLNRIESFDLPDCAARWDQVRPVDRSKPGLRRRVNARHRIGAKRSEPCGVERDSFRSAATGQ